MSDWIRVYEREVRRRRRVAAEDPELYKKVAALNPKGLLAKDKCKLHCWVPATHLMIHDGANKPIQLGGVIRRIFVEAKPHTKDGVHIIPQMCWYCDDYRIKEISSKSTEERLKELKSLRPKKSRGRKPTGSVESILDDLFTL